MVTPFVLLRLTGHTWVFSNLGEFGVIWMSKVMLGVMLLAWRREKYVRKPDWLTIVILLAVFADSWVSRDFPWWGT